MVFCKPPQHPWRTRRSEDVQVIWSLLLITWELMELDHQVDMGCKGCFYGSQIHGVSWNMSWNIMEYWQLLTHIDTMKNPSTADLKLEDTMNGVSSAWKRWTLHGSQCETVRLDHLKGGQRMLLMCKKQQDESTIYQVYIYLYQSTVAASWCYLWSL